MKIIKKVSAILTAAAMSCFMAINTYATGIASSTIATGTTQLINDVLSWLLIIAPTVGAVFIVYFCVRRSAVDAQEQKEWNKRIITAVVSTIGAVVAVSLLNIIIGYYQ